jgi:hypothetical protein
MEANCNGNKIIKTHTKHVDLITAEYVDFDILSFSESWLNRSHTDTSLKLSNYQTSFRKDSGGYF